MKKNLFPFFALFFLLSACGPKAPPRVALPEAEAARILPALRLYFKNQEALQSARAYAKVKLKVRGRQASAEEALFVSLPDRFRFETLDDLGNRRFLLVGDGIERLYAKEEGRGDTFRKLRESELKRFLPLTASLEETLGLLVGRIPSVDLNEARVYPESEGLTYRIVTPRAEMVWDSSRRLILSFAYRAEHGKVAYRYEGGDFVPISLGGSPSNPSKESYVTPMKVRLSDLKTKNWVEIRYLNLEWNPKLSPSLFQVTPLDASGSDAQD